MTFDDLRKFASRHNIDNDQYGIYYKEFTFYPDGSIWYNSHNFQAKNSFHIGLVENRTPRQMYHFLGSLL